MSKVRSVILTLVVAVLAMLLLAVPAFADGTVTSTSGGNYTAINTYVSKRTMPVANALATTNPVSNVVVNGPSNATIPVGGSSTFTASCTDTVGNPMYQYWVIGPNSDPAKNYKWYTIQDYTTASTYTMSNLVAGSYTVAIYAMDKSDLNKSNWANAVYGNKTFVLNVGSTATLTASYANGTFSLTVSSTNIHTPLYQFWAEDPSGNWTCVQDYSNSTTASYTAGASGTYNFVVYAVDPNAPHDWTHAVTASASASASGQGPHVVLTPANPLYYKLDSSQVSEWAPYNVAGAHFMVNIADNYGNYLGKNGQMYHQVYTVTGPGYLLNENGNSTWTQTLTLDTTQATDGSFTTLQIWLGNQAGKITVTASIDGYAPATHSFDYVPPTQ